MCTSTESALVHIPLPIGAALKLDAAIVPIDIPLLVGLDVMHEHRLTLKLAPSTVTGKSGWSLPLT